MSLPASSQPDIYVLWGKAQPSATLPDAYHPLICHMVDVAQVARVIWREVLGAAGRTRLSASLGLSEDVAEPWLAFWAGLHDIGKASPAFARKDAAGWERICRAGLPCLPPSAVPAPHGLVTALVLPDLLTRTEIGLPRSVASSVATLLGGHHGVFPRSGEILPLQGAASAVGRGAWERARLALLHELAALLDLPATRPSDPFDHSTAMLLAGLVSVADWIGSNVEYFPYAVEDPAAPPSLDLAAYTERAATQALRALDGLHWRSTGPAAAPASFAAVFPDFEPNALQRQVADLAPALHGPSLVLVEAPMGQGKTEAALYLAEYWSATAGQRGCYFALPTQATSNQMFSRVRDFLERRYPGQAINLQLLHGHASLSAEFELLRTLGDSPFQPTDVGRDDPAGPSRPSVLAAEWFTYRKRGLLAPYGVGTVDQALLAVLQTKHVFVRLFGLAHKTVVIDEVHAYDTYMSTLLEQLLGWLAALGSSVVLLSATLPSARRRALGAAYARGLHPGSGEPPVPAHVPYPRLTWVARTTSDAAQVPPTGESSRSIRLVRRVGDTTTESLDELAQALSAALAGGGCAVVVCNTVRRAQRVFRALQPFFAGLADDGWPRLDLFHARFPFDERDEREKRTLLRFGKPESTVRFGPNDERPVRRPQRAVLVATQVVEQSLDLDFDLMVSDLAPADLVLQRLGRLHRHTRPRPPDLKQPELWLLLPLEQDGLPRFDRGSEAVYDGHVLLRSWLVLNHRAAVRLPDDLEPLVEAVYADQECPAPAGSPLWERWHATLAALQRQMAADHREAEDRWLKPADYGGSLGDIMGEPREEDAPDFHRAHQALTRLADPTVSIVCLYGDPRQPSLDPAGREQFDATRAPDRVLVRRLLGRSVPLADRRVVHRLLATPPPPGWERSALLRHHRALYLDASGEAGVGCYLVRLDDQLGVVVDDAEAPQEEK